MSKTKRYFEEVLDEIMSTFSDQELVDKLRATFGWDDYEINDMLIEYEGR